MGGWVPSEYDEFIGLIYEGDSCCGEQFQMSAFVWCDDYQHNAGDPIPAELFDIVEFDLDLSFSLSQNMVIRLGLESTKANPIEEFLFGFDVKF